MTTQPKTLRALCEEATPGPYMTATTTDGCFAMAKDGSEVSFSGYDYNTVSRANANAELIARLSPEVVLRVYEALNRACFGLDIVEEASQLTALLDGQTSNGDKA